MFDKVGSVLEEVSIDNVEIVKVSRNERIFTRSSSKGNQLKWKSGCKFIKLDLLGYEGMSEVLSSFLLGHADLDLGVDYIEYFPCIIVEDGKLLGEGCYSFDFKKENQELVSAGRLLYAMGMSYGISKEDFLDFISDFIDYNKAVRYIDKILCFDSIIRNDDRHFNNISFIKDNGILTEAPIYDNGCGCLSDCISYPLDVDFNINYGSVRSKPFKERFEDQLGYYRLVIDSESFLNSVRVHSDKAHRALKTIEKSLIDLKGVSWEGI